MAKFRCYVVNLIYIGTLFVSGAAFAGYQLHVMDLNFGDGEKYTVLSFRQVGGPNISVNNFGASDMDSGQTYKLIYEVTKFGSSGNAIVNDYFPKPLYGKDIDQFITHSTDLAQKWIDQIYLDRGIVTSGSELDQALKQNERLSDGRSSFILITEYQNPLKIFGMIRMSRRSDGVTERLPMELSLGIRFPRPVRQKLSHSEYESYYDRQRKIGHLIPFSTVVRRPDGYGSINTGESYTYGDIVEIKNFAVVPGHRRLFPLLLYVAEITGIAREGEHLENYRSPQKMWADAQNRPEYPWGGIDYRYHYDFTGIALPSIYVIESKGELVGYYKSLGFFPVDQNLQPIVVESGQRVRKNKLYKLAISRESYVELLFKIGSGAVGKGQNFWEMKIPDKQILSLQTSSDISSLIPKILRPSMTCHALFTF